MKIVSMPIEMLSVCDVNGGIRPIRFRYVEGVSYKVIKVDSIITKSECKFAGQNSIIYRCQSLVDDVTLPYEIKYDLKTCKWVLYKI